MSAENMLQNDFAGREVHGERSDDGERLAPYGHGGPKTPKPQMHYN
jgi:hypothetical protein